MIAPLSTHPHQTGPIIDEGVIHDLLNPITSIMGNLQLLEELLGDRSDDATRKRLNASLASTHELHAMLENLRQLMNPGLLPEPGVAVELVPLMRVVIGLFPTAISLTGGEGISVIGAEEPLMRALAAVLSAARRAGKVEEIAVASGNSVEIHVAHKGRVIPRAISDAFFTHALAHHQELNGMKIDRAHGLWYARVALERYGGGVRYESREDGGCFVVTLRAR